MSLALRHRDGAAAGDRPGHLPGGDAARRAAWLARDRLPRTYALAMLEHIGCTASSSENAAVTGIIEGLHRPPHRANAHPDGEIPPTGNTVSSPFACFFQIRDGRRVSHHIYFDNLAMMAQLGPPG